LKSKVDFKDNFGLGKLTFSIIFMQTTLIVAIGVKAQYLH